jgi:hypothetical protein
MQEEYVDTGPAQPHKQVLFAGREVVRQYDVPGPNPAHSQVDSHEQPNMLTVREHDVMTPDTQKAQQCVHRAAGGEPAEHSPEPSSPDRSDIVDVSLEALCQRQVISSRTSAQPHLLLIAI